MRDDRKTAVVTGSTGGIGQEVCRLLATRGWDLVLLNRSREKAEKQVRLLRDSLPELECRSYIVDLLDPESVANTTNAVARETPAVSAVYNIAGLLTDRAMASPQGLEGHFVVNTLAPYLVTQGLRPLLAKTAAIDGPSVAVNFSSSAVKGVKRVDLNQLTDPKNAGGLFGAYAQSKAAVAVLTAAMSGELAKEGILTLCVDPGATRTAMTIGGDGMPWFLRLLVPLLFKSPEVQAKKLVEGVASAVDRSRSGAFIVEGRIKPPPAIAANPTLGADLMALLEDITRPYIHSDARR